MKTHGQLSSILSTGAFALGSDGIYSGSMPPSVLGQVAERELRERVAAQQYEDYLTVIAMLKSAFHLTRANESQRKIVADIVGGGAAEADRYTECLFQPDLKLIFSGTPDNWFGRLDSRLGEMPWLGRWIANQRSFEAVKS